MQNRYFCPRHVGMGSHLPGGCGYGRTGHGCSCEGLLCVPAGLAMLMAREGFSLPGLVLSWVWLHTAPLKPPLWPGGLLGWGQSLCGAPRVMARLAGSFGIARGPLLSLGPTWPGSEVTVGDSHLPALSSQPTVGSAGRGSSNRASKWSPTLAPYFVWGREG